MDQLHRLDPDSWNRQEHFAHYLHRVPCTYSVTVNIDVTTLRSRAREMGRKTYPTQIYLLASAVNRFRELRMGMDADDEPGCWDVVHPCYTVFNTEAETFSGIWTPYSPDFVTFHSDVVNDIERHRTATALFPQVDMPPNVFDVSSLPWLEFSAFNLNIDGGSRHLLPIFTIGKYVEDDAGAMLMPLAVQLHHAAADGYHAARFVEAVQAMADNSESWLT